MKKKCESLAQIFSVITLILMQGACFDVNGAPPAISLVEFPSHFGTSSTRSGKITFEDFDYDVAYARFDVADGRYYRQVTAPIEAQDATRGQLYFSLDCTGYGQKVTLAVTLFDAIGERSEPEQLSFFCGEPSVYNFDAEQRQPITTNEQIPLNFFILDDGVTSLAEGAVFIDDNILGVPAPKVSEAVRDKVIPGLTGIWDQCAIEFKLVNVWVVRPGSLEISGGTLEERLFTDQQGRRVIRHGRETGDALRQATFKWWKASQQQAPSAGSAFNVLITGAGILSQHDGLSIESEGFSESVWPTYAVVRWGGLLDNVMPKQMISTLAHELGHNVGLAHPGEDELADSLSDPMNLMLGSGVSPQPRANLVESQCQRAQANYANLKEKLASQSNHEAQPSAEEAGATVDWEKSCPQSICAGKVELVIKAKGFQNLDSFSFASFEYSHNTSERFFEIGIDRTYQDGFSMIWDTTKQANGNYTLRVVVTDAKGIRASTTLQVSVQNK